MTRRFWGGMALAALFLTTGSISFLYIRMKEKVELPSLSVSPPIPLPPPPVEPPPADPVDESAASAPAAPVKDPVKEAALASGKRNILFKWPKPNAKKVFIVGDFNKWTRSALKKGEKGWEISIPIAPGSYEYLFVVDEKRVKDPNNKTVSAGGKSVLKVKPLTD